MGMILEVLLRSRKTRRMSQDEGAQASFAMIAVVILVASSAAGAFVIRKELQERERERQEETLGRMSALLEDVSRELGLVAITRTHEIISSWEEYPVNCTRLSSAYDEQMLDYISSAFPRYMGGVAIDVTNWTGWLFLIEMKTEDIVPSDSSQSDNLSVGGSTMEYENLPPPSQDLIAETTAAPYYSAVGNFTVRARCGEAKMEKPCSFQRPVISVLPFIESKLRTFQSSSTGEYCDLGRVVGYCLSALAQLRVLEGYGVPAYSGGLETKGILTEEDVHRAVAVGLLLEQARIFRGVDESFAQEVAALFDAGGEPGLSALLGSAGRSLDPAELFLWFLGRTGPKIDANTLVAQAIFGTADQISLRLMDYFGWLGVLDEAKELLDSVSETVDSFVAKLTGEDNAEASVVSWLRTAIESTGTEPRDVSLFFAPEGELAVWVPERVYYVEDAAGNAYPVWVGNATLRVDIPEFDLLASDIWSEFYPDYKASQASFTELLTDGLRRLSFDLAACADLQANQTSFNPTDNIDLFSKLALSIQGTSLSLEPEAVAAAARKLPFFGAQYELAATLSEFIDLKGLGPDAHSRLEEAVLSGLSAAVLSSARYQYIPNLGVSVHEQLAEIVRHDVESDQDWGVSKQALDAFDDLSLAFLGRFVDCVNDSVTSADDSFSGPAVDAVASALAYGSSLIPSVEELLEKQLSGLVRSVIVQSHLSGGKRSAYVDLANPFEFWEGDRVAAEANSQLLAEPMSVAVRGGMPPLEKVPYETALGYASLSSLLPCDTLLVQVKEPWDFDRTDSAYPNLHLTSLANLSTTPYSTQWTVFVLGLMDVLVASNGSSLHSVFSDQSAYSVETVRIELSFPVVVHSGWPLEGVEYNPSNTLLSDAAEAARKFREIVWDKIEPIVGWVRDGLERIYGFVERVFETATSFATRVVKFLVVTLQNLVENLQEYVQKIADSALARAVELFVDVLGTVEVRISLHGFVIIVRTNLPDLLFRSSVDKLRIMVYTDRFGPGITLGVRIARLSDGRYDIVANGTLALKDAKIDVVVDPLMLVTRRFVELHCKARTWALDLSIPEVEPYELAEASTADVPGIGALLSNVPIPVLGMSASIEAGIRLKYSLPFPTDVVVNEFESNPQGEDSGKEWVELYNPLDKPKSLDGWVLATSHGKISRMTLQGTIAAGSLMVVTFPETALDNGFPGDPFNDGDSVVLMDPAGAIVDTTPLLSDSANDARTNQRTWDGGPKWVLKTGTPGDSNGPALLMTTSDFIVKALFEAFRQAFVETKLSEVSASLDFLALFAKRVLHNFIENLLSIVKDIIHEVVFFIEVTLNDATGSAGGGFRTSFVVTGEAIVDVLRWLIHTFATFVVNLGRASSPMAYPSFPQQFFSGLYIRFEVLLQVGLPRMMRVIGAVGDLQARYTLAVAVFPNLPAIGKLAGKNWGNWSVGFGAYLEAVPREFVAGFLSKTTGKLVDFWIVKARVYGV